MKYRVTVFFNGPRCAWGEKLHDAEIIHQEQAPWLWMARALARSKLGNTGRCAYVIHRDEELIEQVDAKPFIQPE